LLVLSARKSTASYRIVRLYTRASLTSGAMLFTILGASDRDVISVVYVCKQKDVVLL